MAHGIKPTANRIVVLRCLASAERPMSLSELEYKILSIDKSGIFRALALFKENRLACRRWSCPMATRCAP